VFMSRGILCLSSDALSLKSYRKTLMSQIRHRIPCLQHTATIYVHIYVSNEKRCTLHSIYTYTATHCNALQRTATHCNTLRHTATIYIHIYVSNEKRCTSHSTHTYTYTYIYITRKKHLQRSTTKKIHR